MTSHSLKWLPSMMAHIFYYTNICNSLIFYQKFDLVCGRLYGLIRACISDPDDFNGVSQSKDCYHKIVKLWNIKLN